MTRNVAVSVHKRLLNIARQSNRHFNDLLQHYALERWLFRLSRSAYAGRFVLKGALLLVAWNTPATRPTFGNAQLPPSLFDRLPAACRAYQFPSKASLRMALSSSASARSFFSRLFSCSSCLSRLASSAFIPPYWLRQR